MTTPDDDRRRVRELLAALPNPGPMPPEVTERVSTALALGRRPRRRGLWLAAAAAAVLVGGGTAVLTTQVQPRVTASESSASDGSASKRSASDGPSSNGPESPVGGGAVPQPSGGVEPGSVLTASSGQAFSAAGLPGAAAALRNAAASGVPPAGEGTTREVPGTAGLLSSSGARRCATALGAPPEAAVLLEAGTVGGGPGALVVLVPASGAATAYLVGPGCAQGRADVTAGPVPVG
ncbi:MAG TPA: hypothetical protein VES95_03490 [Dermatophilaceae bacterium]|nr:hypothetical protein [Dermatophilaceae bacterium]